MMKKALVLVICLAGCTGPASMGEACDEFEGAIADLINECAPEYVVGRELPKGALHICTMAWFDDGEDYKVDWKYVDRCAKSIKELSCDIFDDYLDYDTEECAKALEKAF